MIYFGLSFVHVTHINSVARPFKQNYDPFWVRVNCVWKFGFWTHMPFVKYFFLCSGHFLFGLAHGLVKICQITQMVFSMNLKVGGSSFPRSKTFSATKNYFQGYSPVKNQCCNLCTFSISNGNSTNKYPMIWNPIIIANLLVSKVQNT